MGTKDNGVDCLIKAQGKTKLFHINMLKKYFRRDPVTLKPDKVQFCVMEDSHSDMTVNANIHGWNISNNLSEEQKEDIKSLLSIYPDVFSDKHGYTTSIERVTSLETDKPVSMKPHQIPHHLVEVFNKEVENMIGMGVIEPSNSPCCSPVVLVKKADGT